MDTDWDKSILEHFLDIKEGKKFQKMVTDIRKSLGVPPGGILIGKKITHSTKNETGGKLDAVFLNTLNQSVNKLFKDLNLEPYLKEIVIWFIKYGENTLDDELIPETKDETVHCYLKFDNGDFLIGIRPGATENEVRNFLHKHWSKIKTFPESILENPPHKSPRVKNKPKRSRDKKIMELYDEGLITAAGLVNKKNAPTYFKRFGIEPPFTLNDIGDVLEIEMPDISAIKKIIERYQKLRKR